MKQIKRKSRPKRKPKPDRIQVSLASVADEIADLKRYAGEVEYRMTQRMADMTRGIDNAVGVMRAIELTNRNAGSVRIDDPRIAKLLRLLNQISD